MTGKTSITLTTKELIYAKCALMSEVKEKKSFIQEFGEDFCPLAVGEVAEIENVITKLEKAFERTLHC